MSISLVKQKAEMQPIVQALWDEGIANMESGKEANTMLVAMRLRFQSIFGDLSDYPDEVEDTPTGRRFVELVNRHVTFWKSFAEFKSKFLLEIGKLDARFKAGEISAEKLPDEWLKLFAGGLAGLFEQDPAEMSSFLSGQIKS